MNVSEINILSEEKVIFSGPVGSWKTTDVDMILYKREVENMEVKKRLLYHDKVFLLV